MDKNKSAGGKRSEAWLQRLIASALSMGIGKRELMEDYYLEEISEVISAWNGLHGRGEEAEEEMDAMAFFGGGGERVE